MKWFKRKEQLDEYGQAWVSQLLAEYDLLEGKTGTRAEQIIQDAAPHHREAPSTMTWGELHRLHLALLEVLPPEKLRWWVQDLREGYRDIVGEEAYARLVDECKIDDPATEEQTRAHAQFLLRGTHMALRLNEAHERTRSRLTAGVTLTTLGVCLVLGISIALSDRRTPTLALVAISGALGGLISVLRRLHTTTTEGDSLNALLSLRHGRTSLLLAPLNGAVFAVLLYIFFLGGFLQGALFPVLGAPEAANGKTPTLIPDSANFKSTLDLLLHMGSVNPAEVAKLFIWSFIAGFAERFVPGVIDRMVAKTGGDAPAG
jgi:hypothetical protein